MDEQDYRVFLNYLKEYLSPPTSRLVNNTPGLQGVTLQYRKARDLNSKYFEEIQLLAFCLMPNHFHLVIKQKDSDSIKKFTQSLFTRYSMYFNKKHDRVGALFQSTYKATNAISEDYLLDLTKYIHLNPVENLIDAYSSYKDYLGITNTVWVNKNIVLDKFKDNAFVKFQKIKSYREFVENFRDKIEDITL